MLPLFVVLVVRGSRAAWGALVVLDAISLLVLVLATPAVDEAPLLLHILLALALGTLLLPSARRYVSAPR